MNKLEEINVTELRYLGYGNPLVENHFRVTLDNGRAFNIVTDKTLFPIKYGAALVSIKAENKDYVLCFDKRLVATLQKTMDDANKGIRLGTNQCVTVLTEAQADEVYATHRIPHWKMKCTTVVDIFGKRIVEKFDIQEL